MTQERSTADGAQPGEGSRAGATAPARDGDSRPGLGTRGAGLLLLAALVVLGGIFLAIPFAAGWAVTEFPSVVLLIAGFVTVTLILYIGTVLMTALGMRTPAEALGMPPGSIRALIAMVLILIFAIIGVVVLNQSTSLDVYTSTGVTQAQIDSIRAGGGTVLQQDLESAAPAAPGASPAEPLYTARIRQAMTPESHDFALQLLTTVSTLVVAVAGFYFGSKNVDTAAAAARASRAPERPAPEVVPAVPDRSRDEDPGDGTQPGTTPGQPGPQGDEPGGAPAGGTPAAPPPGGDGGSGEAEPPPVPAPGDGDPALETADSLDDETHA